MYDEQIRLAHSVLGKPTAYISHYKADLLQIIPRNLQREDIGITQELPFIGNDIWNAYEISWLNNNGKPMIATAELIAPCESPYIVESKSLKLYLYSFNNSRFDSYTTVAAILERDLSKAFGAPVLVQLTSPMPQISLTNHSFNGLCLDNLDVSCDTYTPQTAYLKTGKKIVTESLYSNLLRSNCLVTGQPDWGSVQINYTGKQIEHSGLLKYIISFRNHTEFAEHCVERIFMNILTHCKPEKLFVYARYTRRGGIDINPYRANYNVENIDNVRLFRQ